MAEVSVCCFCTPKENTDLFPLRGDNMLHSFVSWSLSFGPVTEESMFLCVVRIYLGIISSEELFLAYFTVVFLLGAVFCHLRRLGTGGGEGG